MKLLIRILFAILNFIVFCAFTFPYILTESGKGEDFSNHFWSEPFSWILLAAFLIVFPIKFLAIRSIRKRNLHFKNELGSQTFWLLMRGFITGIWITWIMNGAIFNNDIIGGLSFGGFFFALIFYFYWLVYGKNMRRENEKRFIETLSKIENLFPAANPEEISKLDQLLTQSEIYDDRDKFFSKARVGSPARSFVVHNRVVKIESNEKKSGNPSDPKYFQNYNLLEWRFYFCVLTDSIGTKKPGQYSKSQFISLFDKKIASLYKNALDNFHVSSIEIKETGYVIGINPKYDLASLGIRIPQEDEINNLFKVFEQ